MFSELCCEWPPGCISRLVAARTNGRKAAAGILGDTMREAETMGQMGTREQEGVTEESISERRLWTAVIVHAVEDWQKGTLRARREAQKFLFEDISDFQSVCASAGLDPATLRARLLKIGKRVAMQGPYLHPMAA